VLRVEASNPTARAAAVRVRPVAQPEYARAGALCVAAYRADGQLPAEPAANRYDYSVALADVADRVAHGEVLVAQDTGTGELLGCVTFVHPGSRYADLAGPGEGEFRMLAVAPTAQGRGVGHALVRACLDRATGCGYAAVVICVRDFSAPAKRLYARFGFQRVPQRDFTPVPGVRLEVLRLSLVAPAR